MSHHTLSLAKRRARARKSSAGAIIFIVAMTLAVLASLGLYALSASATEVKTSGYGRQAAQTHYLSEYGLTAGATDVSGTNAQLYLGMMLNATTRDSKCVSLMNVPTTASNLSQACRRMGATEIQGTWGTSKNAVETWVPGTSAGSLGPFPLKGDFFVEVTDVGQGQMPPGYDQNLGLCFIGVTMASVGITEPDLNLLTGSTPDYGTVSTTSFYASQGLETSRALVRAGPVRCPR